MSKKSSKKRALPREQTAAKPRPQDLLVRTALISRPTLTWVHGDPRAMVLNVNAACFHGAGESVLNAALTVSNYPWSRSQEFTKSRKRFQ